ncbi:MAG: hypothetical protein COA79_01420 [Planctomycetota bacterium]|nr:MAG: hypothetical protein COA79_01420 [Planctomycetota bacterium]
MVVKRTDKVRFKCFNCGKVLLGPISLLEKTTKCPACQTKLTPINNLVQKKNKSKNKINSDRQLSKVPVKNKKVGLRGLFFLNLLIIPLILFAILYKKEVEYDKALLLPVIKFNSKQVDIIELNEMELNAVIASIDDLSLLPTGNAIPEFAPFQSRPTRYYLGQCVKKAKKILAGKTIEDMKFKGTEYLDSTFKMDFEILNQAFAKNKTPIYLEFIFGRFINVKTPNTFDITQVLKSLAMHKSILKEIPSGIYIQCIAKIKNSLDMRIHNVASPIEALDLLNISILLPKGLNQQKAIRKAKPILEDAFKHINKTRSDGLFLSPDESTEFSLKCIQIAWQYHLEKGIMPKWLYQLTEKESCRLAYRLEADGCLPVWEKGKPRINLSQHIYKASKVFDRDDLRYIAHQGLRVKDANPPKKLYFSFPEIGIFTQRNNWDISAKNRARHYGGKKLHTHNLQVTLDSSRNELSVSAGPITQIILSFGEHQFKRKYFQKINISRMSFKGQNMRLDFDAIDIKPTIKTISRFYLINGNEIKSDDIFHFNSEFTQLTKTFQIYLDTNQDNSINKIDFRTKKRKSK